MLSRVFFLFLCGVISAHLGYAQKLPKVKKLNMKVHINMTGDTLTMKFHRPNQSIKLEGFILGYGSNYFSNQYFQWPENGKSYVTDVEAETRYLIAVKPNEKTCKEKNSSQKPLQLVIGTLTPTSVFLSWGILVNPQIDWSALSKCPNDRFYTVRYREKNRDWNFQLCPTTETVVDNLKPNTIYEFGVKDNSDDEIWGKSQNHKTSPKGKENGNIENTYKIPKGSLQYASEDTKALIPVIIVKQGFQNITKSTAAPPPAVRNPVFREETKKPPLTTTRPSTPKPKTAPKTSKKVPIHVIAIQFFDDPDVSMVPNTTLTPSQSTTTKRPETPHTTPVPVQKVSQPITQKPKPTPRTRTKPAIYRVQHSSSRPRISLRPRTRPGQNGTTQGSIRPRPTGDFNWAPGTIPGGRVLDSTKLLGVSRNISMEPNTTGKRTFSVSSPPLPPVKPTSIRRRIQYSNVTGRPGVTVSSPPLPPVKPTTIHRRPPANGTAKPAPTVDPTVFNPSPKSDIDALGKPRFTAPHVKYMDKADNVPCSITESLRHFPTEESTNQEILTPPQNPPSNLTVVTVEGCSSFVILDWEMPDNDTATEFKVISTENGAPEGKNQSIIMTNQTYSTVENLKPDTRYDFKVIPTNTQGVGPSSKTKEFHTESADPRVSDPVTGGKDAIWTEIKFKSDSYSECKGKQYVKRTWYKKFVGIQLCNSLRYKIYLSNSLTGTFYNIGDQTGYGEDHCQFVDSFLDGRTGQQLLPEQLTTRQGFYRSVRQQPVEFGEIGGQTHIGYVHWYECGIAIPGKW